MACPAPMGAARISFASKGANMVDISKLPFAEWVPALHRGEITIEEAHRELAKARAYIEFFALAVDPEWREKPVNERWARACKRAKHPQCPVPDDVLAIARVK